MNVLFSDWKEFRLHILNNHKASYCKDYNRWIKEKIRKNVAYNEHQTHIKQLKERQLVDATSAYYYMELMYRHQLVPPILSQKIKEEEKELGLDFSMIKPSKTTNLIDMHFIVEPGYIKSEENYKIRGK